MKPRSLIRRRMRVFRHRVTGVRWAFVEWWGDMQYSGRRLTTRRLMCALGLHWPIKWDEAAIPMQYDPPHPPEPGFCCQQCGDLRLPYRSVFWPLSSRVRWYLHTPFERYPR